MESGGRLTFDDCSQPFALYRGFTQGLRSSDFGPVIVRSETEQEEPMKRTLILAAISIVALAAAGLAVAKGLNDAKSVRGLAGTFTATTASKIDSRSCTTADNKTLVTTTGVYTGTATGDPDLTGNVTIRAKSIINTTDNVGVVSGTLRIDVANGRDTATGFDSVYAGGKLAGLAEGRAHDPAARLVANLSADFTSTGGFANGKLGGTTGGGAAEVVAGHCKSQKVPKEKSEARGLVSAVSPTSITVAGLTCAVPTELQAKLNGVTVGKRAEIHCRLVNNANTLTSINVRK
jgi:hypothetical protein